MLDFTKPNTFLSVTFKPSKYGAVRKSQVLKMLKSGQAECYTYEYDDMTGVQRSIMDAENLAGLLDERRGECRLSYRREYGNPRYANQTYISVRFHGNSFVHIYDVRDLPELAEPTEEVSEGCQAIQPGLRLAYSSGEPLCNFHWRKAD